MIRSIFYILLCAGLLAVPPALCQDPPAGNAPGIELTTTLYQTLAASNAAETKALATTSQQLSQARRDRIYLLAATNGYKLQLSTFSNLLLSDGTDLTALQKARAALKSTLVEIQRMTQSLSPETREHAADRETLDRQIELTQKQIEDLQAVGPPNGVSPKLQKQARELKGILKKKAGLLDELVKIYQDRLSELQTVEASFSELSLRFDTAIEQKKTQTLFERQGFRLGIARALTGNISDLWQRALRLLSPPFWTSGWKSLWQSAGPVAFSLIIALSAALVLLIRFRRGLIRWEFTARAETLGPWHGLAATLFSLTVIPGGTAVILYLYSRLTTMYLIAPALRALALIILTLMSVRWCLTALSGQVGQIVPGGPSRLIRLGQATGLVCLVYLPVSAVLGGDAALLTALRLTFSFSLTAWTLWKFKEVRITESKSRTEAGSKGLLGIKYLLLFISTITLVMDMFGYGSLCAYWLLSWGRTILIALWWGLFLAMLREWDRNYMEKSRNRQNQLLYDHYPVQWLIIRMGQLVWLISLAAVLLLAWGSRKTVLEQVYLFLIHPVAVGNMTFSLMGIICAGLVILVTQALSRIWRWLFQTKFLSKSGMGIGLQDAITTISVYIIWALGILIALHVFGLNTASLTVVFGALGIGLGFGLQNIFNNFISGIILLFERPIQVGDDVEINGTWAQVRKINVRSTVVQTYDNASLIIPNADFISNQVTNWSFKDKRIRRRITVGVAYGSDTARVRDTLLEIADQAPRALKYPRPDVLFQDFADSALIFTLRLWTDIDSMLEVDTHVRFEIDRLFRERDIEISFPQRDIHIRSVPRVEKEAKMHVPEPLQPDSEVGEDPGHQN